MSPQSSQPSRYLYANYMAHAAPTLTLTFVLVLGACTGEPERPAHAPAGALPSLDGRQQRTGVSSRDSQSALLASRATRPGHTLALGESRIHVSVSPAASATSATSDNSREREAAVLAWVERCARAVQSYYGVFPVLVLELHVRSAPGAGIHGGQTLPTSPPRIEIVVGESSSEQDYESNWSLTHEMVHLAFPNVPSAHHWLEEGLATYVEPIARARSGWVSEESVWREWIENMPLGLPAPNDAGLDGTDSWGRTYWGGALYCLLADVEIRKRSAGRHGLADALRAIVAAGGSVSQRWPLERALRIGDQATGTTALADTYAAMKDQPLRPDLADLWRQLGVQLDAGRLRYDDGAALASVRQSIVAGLHAPNGR